ncbi:MAG: LPP20 family lipoprotein [Treponema sp.]|jgi:hypothetical protein|nr:LPP20 family lipoprotein [Treponema sp.]
MALMSAGTVIALPSFVTDPPSDGQYYYEFGEAEGNDAARAWKVAEGRARESLRHQIETRIKAIQIDYEAWTERRAESFFTEVLHVTSDVSVQAKRVKSEYEGGKYYVLVITEGVEEEVLKRVLEQARKTNDPNFEQAVKESMKRASDKADSVIRKVNRERRKAERERKAAQRAAKGEEQADYAKRNSLGINIAMEWAGDEVGMGVEALEFHWSLLPFTSVGIRWYPYFIGGYDTLEFEDIALGGSLYAGLVYPFTTYDYFNVRLYTDVLFNMQGVLFDGKGLVGAGFDAGLAVTASGWGFDIRYRGVVYEEQYVNSFGIGFVMMFNDW